MAAESFVELLNDLVKNKTYLLCPVLYSIVMSLNTWVRMTKH
jgi:hypothetical protein